jgi:hypothetical protein
MLKIIAVPVLSIGAAFVIAIAWIYAAALNYPAVVVQGWMLALDFSLQNGVLLAGAGALSVIARYVGAGGYLGTTILHARLCLDDVGALTVLPTESVTRVIPQSILSLVPEELWSLSAPFSWFKNPTEWIVCLARDPSRRPLGSVISFRTAMRACVSFLPDHPERLTVYQRFGLRRAAAHCLSGSLMLDRFGQQQVFIWSVIWLAVLANWTPVTMVPLFLMLHWSGVYWRLHVEADWLYRFQGDIWTRDEIKIDEIAANSLTDDELVELDECLQAYPFMDPTARAAPGGGREALLANVLAHRFLASAAFSGHVRTIALRLLIQRKLDPSYAKRSAEESDGWGSIFPFATPIVSLASGACMAVLGQNHAPWRLWLAGGVLVVCAFFASLSWRHLFRSRRRLMDAIRAASVSE